MLVQVSYLDLVNNKTTENTNHRINVHPLPQSLASWNKKRVNSHKVVRPYKLFFLCSVINLQFILLIISQLKELTNFLM